MTLFFLQPASQSVDLLGSKATTTETTMGWQGMTYVAYVYLFLLAAHYPVHRNPAHPWLAWHWSYLHNCVLPKAPEHSTNNI